MDGSSTPAARARRSDPFRILLGASLFTIVVWIVAISGGGGEATTPTARAGDIDQPEPASIIVALDDETPFDLPLEPITETDIAPSGAAQTPSSVGSGTGTRASAGGQRGTRPSTGGRTTRPPAGGPTAPAPTPVTPAPVPVAPVPTSPGVGQDGTPGEPVAPVPNGHTPAPAPGVTLPLPAVTDPIVDEVTGSGSGTGNDKSLVRTLDGLLA